LSNRPSEQALVLTFVARSHHNLEEALTLSALARASLSAEKVRWLSKTEGSLAVEAIITEAERDDPRLQDLAISCKDVAGAGIDWALTPLTNRKKRLLICDMDSTIIAEECLDELADFAGLKAEISAITERAMAGELNFEEALTTRVGMLEGLSLDAIAQCYKDRIHLNPGAKTLVATMKANGAHCLLVSGGFTDFTQRVAQAAGFDGHHANTLLNDGQALTGKVGMPILGREAKLDRLSAAASAHGLTPADALAMGDGANDLAMITAAGLGLAFRAKPIVAAKAHAAINATDLTTALFFQGYSADQFITE